MRTTLIVTYTYLGSDHTFTPEHDSFLIGRSQGGPVDIDLGGDSMVSRRHARMTYERGDWWIEDLKSRSGTSLNGTRVAGKVRVESGARVKVGETELRLELKRAGVGDPSQSTPFSRVGGSTTLEPWFRTARQGTTRRAVTPAAYAVPSHGAGQALLIPGDAYLVRLAKYIPGEVTAAFLVGAASAPRYVLLAGLVCLAITPIYAWVPGRSLPRDIRPKPHFYLLTAVAFACWAIAVNRELAALLSIDRQLSALLVLIATLVIPAIDLVLDVALPRRLSIVPNEEHSPPR